MHKFQERLEWGDPLTCDTSSLTLMLAPIVCKLCALQERLERGDPLTCDTASLTLMLTPIVCKLCALQERLEWGDPLACSDVWHCIRNYSPYDNLDDAWARSASAHYCPSSETEGGPAKQANAPLVAAEWKETAGEGEAVTASGESGSSWEPADSSAAAERAPHRRGMMPSSSFPHLMLTASLHDPRVPFHEPAKYIAKLRALASGWSARAGGRMSEPAAADTFTPAAVGWSARGGRISESSVAAGGAASSSVTHGDPQSQSAASSGGGREEDKGGRPPIALLLTRHGRGARGRLERPVGGAGGQVCVPAFLPRWKPTTFVEQHMISDINPAAGWLRRPVTLPRWILIPLSSKYDNKRH